MLVIARVSGDSMEPTLHSGDRVLIDRTQARVTNDGIYGYRIDDDLLVKRISLHPETRLLKIASDNPRYDAWTDIRPDRIDIIGRVICLWHQID